MLDLREQHRLRRRLARVAAPQTEDLFKKRLVPPSPPLPHAQIVLDHTADHGLVELVGELGPGGFRAGVNEGVAAALGEGRERLIARLAMDEAVRLDAAPEANIDQRLETVRGQQWLDPAAVPELSASAYGAPTAAANSRSKAST